jgi:hypothetical protein
MAETRTARPRDVYEVRPRKDKRGLDLMSNALRRNGVDEG